MLSRSSYSYIIIIIIINFTNRKAYTKGKSLYKVLARDMFRLDAVTSYSYVVISCHAVESVNLS